MKRSSLSGLTDGVEDLLDISSVDRLSFIRQSSKVRGGGGVVDSYYHTYYLLNGEKKLGKSVEAFILKGGITESKQILVCSQVKFTSAVKLLEGGAVGPEFARDEEENFFKRLGKWRSGRRNPSKLHHTEEKDGRPPPPRGAPCPPLRPTVLSIPPSLSLFTSLAPFCPCGVVPCLAKSWSFLFCQFLRPPFSLSAKLPPPRSPVPCYAPCVTFNQSVASLQRYALTDWLKCVMLPDVPSLHVLSLLLLPLPGGQRGTEVWDQLVCL